MTTTATHTAACFAIRATNQHGMVCFIIPGGSHLHVRHLTNGRSCQTWKTFDEAEQFRQARTKSLESIGFKVEVVALDSDGCVIASRVRIERGHPYASNCDPTNEIFELFVDDSSRGWFATEAEAKWHGGMIVAGH